MNIAKESSIKKNIRALEITKAYAEYKIRHTGDLDADLVDWKNNIMCIIKKAKK